MSKGRGEQGEQGEQGEMRIARIKSIVGKGGSLCFAVLLGLGGVRVLVSFMQSLAMLKSERENDLELAGLCDRNIASSSAKMRAACLSLAAESASPILAAAMLRTVSMLFADVQTTLLAPLNGGSTFWLLCFGCAGALAMQQVLLRRGLIVPPGHRIRDCDDDPHSHNHVIVMRGAAGGAWDSGLLRHRPGPSRALLMENGMSECNNDSEFCELSLGEHTSTMSRGPWQEMGWGPGLGRKRHVD